jgi:hypothetical protein
MSKLGAVKFLFVYFIQFHPFLNNRIGVDDPLYAIIANRRTKVFEY